MENSAKKNVQETAEQTAIVEAVKVIGNQAEANPDQDTAVFTASSVNGVIQIAAAGSPAQLIKLIARAVNADKKLGSILEAAVEAAPMLGLFDMFGKKSEGDDTPCDCPNCTAEREAAKVNVN